jgi:hypothetical protein
MIPDPDILDRLFSYIEIGGPQECWPWLGAATEEGYSLFAVRDADGHQHNTTASRELYKQCVGDVPDEWEVDHRCRFRRCMNRRHLEAVPLRVNRQRRNEAKTHCRHGHEYTPENTRWQMSRGYWGRVCRSCENARHRKLRRQ